MSVENFQSGAQPKDPFAKELKRRLAGWSRYYDIVFFKTYANLKRDIDKTYLGTLWWAMEPLIATAVFYLIFTSVLKNRTENFVVFLLIGNVIYNHFSSSLNGGANALMGNAGLMQQTMLPKTIYPVIAICNLSWKFLFSLVVIFPLLWILKSPVSWAYLALPLLLGWQIFAVIVLSLPLCILMPYFQDGRTVLSTLLGIGIWFSGVFYDAAKLPEHLRFWFYLNPIAPLIEAYRAILIHGTWPAWPHFTASALLCFLAWGTGAWLIHRLGNRVTKLPM